jgi:hypothetical protein
LAAEWLIFVAHWFLRQLLTPVIVIQALHGSYVKSSQIHLSALSVDPGVTAP